MLCGGMSSSHVLAIIVVKWLFSSSSFQYLLQIVFLTNCRYEVLKGGQILEDAGYGGGYGSNKGRKSSTALVLMF